MADLLQLARRSPSKFPKAQGPRCIFCGSGSQWYGLSERQPGCSCDWARRVRGDCKPAEKLEFQMLERLETGRLVITKCSPELWAPLIETGLAVAQSGFGAALGKELPEDSRQAMYAAGAAFKAKRDSVPLTELPVPLNPAPGPPVGVTPGVDVTASVTCEVCGKGFEPERSTARYCSGACRKRAQRKR